MSLIIDSIVESTRRSLSMAFNDAETTPFSTNRGTFMEKDNGIFTHEEAVKPIQVDTAPNGVVATSNGDGIVGDHSVNGTNGAKISSAQIVHLGDTSLPPAGVAVSLESSGTCIPKVLQSLTLDLLKIACHGPIRVHQLLTVQRRTRIVDQCFKRLG